MTVVPPPLPLTIAGRSLLDPIRIRWGGLGALCLGIGLLFTGEPAGAFFGVVLAALGIATWVLSSFGATYWYDIPSPQKYVVGTGAVVGFLTFIVFIGSFLIMASIIQLVGASRS